MDKLLKRVRKPKLEFEVQDAIGQEIKKYLDEDLDGMKIAAFSRQCFYGWVRQEHPELMNRIQKVKQAAREAAQNGKS